MELRESTRVSIMMAFSLELYTKTWVSSSMTQFSMELTHNTRVSIMMTFSLELIQKHEFLLRLPNFLWNLHRTQEFPLWWHFLWNLHTNMSFFFYDWILYGTYITQEFPSMPHFLWNLHNTICLTIFWRFNTFLCKLFIY
jgi:hypothetical protein